MAAALRELGFYIGQRGLDDPSHVMEVLRGAKLSQVFRVEYIDRRHGLYVVLLDKRGCRNKCMYESECRSRDEECINRCTEECAARLLDKAAEALMKYAARLSGRKRSGAGPTPNVHSG